MQDRQRALPGTPRRAAPSAGRSFTRVLEVFGRALGARGGLALPRAISAADGGHRPCARTRGDAGLVDDRDRHLPGVALGLGLAAVMMVWASALVRLGRWRMGILRSGSRRPLKHPPGARRSRLGSVKIALLQDVADAAQPALVGVAADIDGQAADHARRSPRRARRCSSTGSGSRPSAPRRRRRSSRRACCAIASLAAVAVAPDCAPGRGPACDRRRGRRGSARAPASSRRSAPRRPARCARSRPAARR